ncbi:phosphatase PAP2 family protein [Microbacterium pygmaeum]|uniref:Undecaprenyl-diphosphatase n=1 Tax=Microbacterium pygmaeum TaxID=370764 RepID=A0A1G8DIB4_9MICO|nr:phosphatase PAP2 family protein [Microbacterium pygmaeum]SDH57423.1 undecaprenyl-diphosphatase [Microbacterium pygmaeum]
MAEDAVASVDPADVSEDLGGVEPDGRRGIVLAVAIGAAVAFVTLRLVVSLSGRAPLPIDVWWNDLMVATMSDASILVAWVPAIVGGTIGMAVIGLLLVGVFSVRRRWWDAATIASAVIAIVAIGAPMAAVIARVRPEDSLAESVATSFPSGHTAVATAVAMTLGLLLRRWYVWLLGVLWVLLMMWSRTHLHAHWLSDVVAGMLEGIAIACLVWCAIEALRDRRAARAAATPSPSS